MRRRSIRIALVLVVVLVSAAVATVVTVSRAAAVDAAFNAFWMAQSPVEAADMIPEIVNSGVSVDDALKRLRAGRPYSDGVETGVVTSSYTAHGKEFIYAVNVPRSYDPRRSYQVRFQLHGGVVRESSFPLSVSIGALAGAEQIYILPTGWAGATWWSDAQIENFGTILDTVKRAYNVDENRVVISGTSDGGTGVYYIAMKDTTPYASFLPLNGHMLVLRTEPSVRDVFPSNLRNKPLFVVNGDMDPLYPTSIVAPYMRHLQTKGVEVVYQPQPNGVHNTAWWPQVKESFEGFVKSHPRNPLPDSVTWETDGSLTHNRAHWLVIDELGPADPNAATLDDVNELTAASADLDPLGVGPKLFEQAHPSGRVDLVRTGNTVTATTRGITEFTLLISPEAFDLGRPVNVVANGKTVFEGRVEPKLDTLLRWGARDNDRTMLFVAELHIRP
jgi:hypothetical protein